MDHLLQYMPKPASLMGVDLGQRADYTALSVLERHLVPTRDMRPGKMPRYTGDGYESEECGVIPVTREYRCRHLDRYRDVPYPDVVDDVVRLIDAVEEDRIIVVDVTGVGLPIFDSLHRALLSRFGSSEHNLTLIGVLIHGGDRVTPPKRGVYGVPKRDLAGVSQVLLESKRLKVAEGLELSISNLTLNLHGFQ